MLRAAIFGAFTTVDTNLVGAEDLFVVMAWNNIRFTRDFRYPEAVNDVVRDFAKVNNRTLRNVERIGSHNVLVGIVKLPPPLVTDCRYTQVAITANVLQ